MKRRMQIIVIWGVILLLLGTATGSEKIKKEYIGTYIYEYKKPSQGGSPIYHIYILEIEEDGSYRLTRGTIVPSEWQYLWQPKVQNGDWEVVTKEEQERELRQLRIPREEIEREIGRIEEVISFSPQLPVEPAPLGGIWSLIKKGNKLISSASTIEFFPQTADIAFVKKESIEEIERYRRQIESTVERKEEPKPQIAGYTAKFNNLNYFLGSMRAEVLECPKESCNDEEEAAKVLISHLLTKKSGEWLYGYLLGKMTWNVVKKLILSGLDEVIQMGISAGEAVIKEKITEIKEKYDKTHRTDIEVFDLGWKDIGVLPIYLPYKERNRRYGNGEALMVFYSPHSISFKEIKKQVKSGGSFYVPPIGLYEKLRKLPDEDTVRPFKLIIRGTVYEVGEVGTRETWGETIKGPWVSFYETTPKSLDVAKDHSVKPTDSSFILGKWVPEYERKVYGKHVSTLEFRKDGTLIETVTFNGKWEVKGSSQIVLSTDPHFFPVDQPIVETYQIEADALRDSFGNVWMKDKDARLIKQTIRGRIWDRYNSGTEGGIKREVQFRNEGTFLSTLYISVKWQTDGKVVKVYTPEGKESPWIYEIKGEKLEVTLKEKPQMKCVPYIKEAPDVSFSDTSTQDSYKELRAWLFGNNASNAKLTAGWNIKDCSVWGPEEKPFLWDCRHTGIDYKASEGMPVYSATDGKVIRVEDGADCNKPKCLSTVAIYNESVKATFIYLHMKDIKVKLGDKVRAGDLIGKVGQRGYAKCPHLHFEAREGKKTHAANDVRHTINPYEAAKKARDF